MTAPDLSWWDSLRHGGLLIDAARLRDLATDDPTPLVWFQEKELRKQVNSLIDGTGDIPRFVAYVLEKICGFSGPGTTWQRGSSIPADWTRQGVAGEAIKPRQLWSGRNGSRLPVFVDREKRVGVGRGRRITSQVLQWLRAGTEQLALITNGRQWRLVFAGLDYDAWCEWDVELWFEEGKPSNQVKALKALLTPDLWTPPSDDQPSKLLQAIRDSRKGQSELSQVLGERVRHAVEILVQGHGEVLKEEGKDIDPADIYRAAVRVVMRMVVVLFAEARELLPRDNAVYHRSYGLQGLREELEKIKARGTGRLNRSFAAWPRMLSLFRLIHKGSDHPALQVPLYGGELFSPGDAGATDGVSRAVAIFETACYKQDIVPDRDVHKILDLITRTKVKIRQGRSSIQVPAPVDFSDLSSEYIGILYEGLLDFELRTAPGGDPVVFLAVGNQPALPLSRLEGMDTKAIRGLLEKLKDTSSADGADAAENAEEAASEAVPEEVDEDSENNADSAEEADAEEEAEDERHSTRTRAEQWARRAVDVGNLARKPRGKLSPEKKLKYEQAKDRKARQLVARVVLPGEWYLVRWGGTRKGAGTFYTRPGLAVPTVQRTLRPLAFEPPKDAEGKPDRDAAPSRWTPKKPEEILALKVCDPACGSGSFPVAALRFLTDALYASVHSHGRIAGDGGRTVVSLLTGDSAKAERLCDEYLPCRPDHDLFEPRLKAVLRRHVVERCIYGVELDPVAVELCRLSLWIETMDRTLPFSFIDHKIKCGNSLVGAWFDQFQHYPAMAWKNRDGGDGGHGNGVHFEKGARTKAIKDFVREQLTPDLADAIRGQAKLYAPAAATPEEVHGEALALVERLHELPVQDSAERARLYRKELLGSAAYQSLRSAMDLWCACWFWPADRIDCAPLPSNLADPPAETRAVAENMAAAKRFFHWELEFPDVFREEGSGFDATIGNPPWEIAKPNSMEFFSNIDPLYRSYGKQEALRYQSGYFDDESFERAWLDYNGDFRAQSNFMKYRAAAFGDPSESDKSQDRFSIVRGRLNAELHTLWRRTRSKSRGFADPAHPFRYQGSADINLYKLFLEQGHALLAQGGRLGLIIPSGLYSDHGTGVLRALFLKQCRWEWLFGFENRDKIFDIDSRFKFNPVIIEKGGTTAEIRTAFMRRKLEDWEGAESISTPYTRERVERFSPRSKAILEIQSARDLEILEKIYTNSVLLGDDGPDGWGIKYAREFDMTNDSKLFPPRPKWEEKGYRPDEYSRWLLGDWRPIGELWAELGVNPLPEGERRCAQPPYDTLPVPRADIPAGVLLSREGDAWVREERVEDVALPLYEGRMIGQFDFSQKGWVSGKGRSSVWKNIDWLRKGIEPQFLMAQTSYLQETQGASLSRVLMMDVTSTTNERTLISSFDAGHPSGHKTPTLTPRSKSPQTVLAAVGVLNSFVFDYLVRARLGGNSLIWSVLEATAIPPLAFRVKPYLGTKVGTLCLNNSAFGARAFCAKPMAHASSDNVLALCEAERLRCRVILDALVAACYTLERDHLNHVLADCDWQNPVLVVGTRQLNPKGFWRIEKAKDPELRHTVLTLVAFHDLQQKIDDAGGDREKGIDAFCNQNDGEGWMLPETLRLADYGLGHDDRAKENQPVASRLGPRFYDWQLAQSAKESWRECHLHARNLLGEEGYRRLLDDIEAEKRGEKEPVYGQVETPTSRVAEKPSDSNQGNLFR